MAVNIVAVQNLWKILQKYNGAEIYSYYNTMLPFESCYHVNDDECSVIEFRDFVVDDVKER